MKFVRPWTRPPSGWFVVVIEIRVTLTVTLTVTPRIVKAVSVETAGLLFETCPVSGHDLYPLVLTVVVTNRESRLPRNIAAKCTFAAPTTLNCNCENCSVTSSLLQSSEREKSGGCGTLNFAALDETARLLAEADICSCRRAELRL